MATKTSLQISATDQNDNKTSTTISNVNPELNDAEMYELGVKLNALTTDVPSQFNRVDTRELTNTPKQTATITLSSQPDGSNPTTFGTVGNNLAIWAYILTNSDAKPVITMNTAYCVANIIVESDSTSNYYVLISSKKDPQEIWDETSATYTDINGNVLSKTGYTDSGPITNNTARIMVTVPETETYTSAVATLYVKYA